LPCDSKPSSIFFRPSALVGQQDSATGAAVMVMALLMLVERES
jgi:hypothetical protein